MSIQRTTVLLITTVCLLGSAVSVSAQDDKPSKAELRERLVDQLERTREREQWLEVQLKRFDSGELPEREAFERDQPDKHEPFGGGQPRQFSDEELLLVVKDLREQVGQPGEGGPFRDILASEGAERDRLLRRLAPRLGRLVELRERSPEQYKVHLNEMRAGMDIARAARNLGMLMAESDADESAIEDAKSDLREAISAGFDAKAAMARQELAEVQERLDSLKQEIADAEAEREERIEKQFTAIIKKIKDGGWMKRGRDRRPREGDGRARRSGND